MCGSMRSWSCIDSFSPSILWHFFSWVYVIECGSRQWSPWEPPLSSRFLWGLLWWTLVGTPEAQSTVSRKEATVINVPCSYSFVICILRSFSTDFKWWICESLSLLTRNDRAVWMGGRNGDIPYACCLTGHCPKREMRCILKDRVGLLLVKMAQYCWCRLNAWK